MDWIEIGNLSDIPSRGARTVETPRGQVAVFRTADDAVFALINRCPHRGGPLSEGIVSGRLVACPLHNWVIDLESGAAVAPDEGCAERLSMRVRDGRLWMNLDRAKAASHG
ncbi:MAG: nitrite reductase small subunit NirD [Alphaproteobacteria bacterium]|nr:nitrite reductase small subunit NirD [Alphaproteobacteria bacterium]